MRRAIRPISAALLLAAAASGCLRVRPPVTPMTTLDVSPAAGGPGPCLILFLPGRRDSLGAYRRHPFPKMAVDAGVSAQFVEVDAHMGYYLAQTISGRLYEDVIAPARARGIKRIWIVGISMGGLGGILEAREHPDVAGVIALSPFLGDTEPGRVAAAGGLSAWSPGPPRPVADYERELWHWLQRYSAEGALRPPIYLGFGLQDELAPANRLLGNALPPGRTFTANGNHDWKTWTVLWRQILDAGVLQRDCAGEGRGGSK